MLPNPLRKRLLALATFAGLLMALAGPARADYVVGTWDPVYGGPFTNLGWRGTSISDIPSGCLALGPVGFVVNNGVACALMTVVSAQVEFYALSDITKTTVETLDFTGSATVASIYLDTLTGGLRGLDLVTTVPVLSTSVLAVTGSEQASFSLRLVTLSPVAALARLAWFTDSNPSGGSNDERNYPAYVTFSFLPEPGSLALALAALGGLVLTARRRLR